MYYEMYTFKNWNNQFIQNFESLNLTVFESEAPSLNVSSYPDSGTNYATDTERILYYLFVNGVSNMESISYMQTVTRFDESMQESADSRDQLSLARTVSITILSVILLSLFPVFSELVRLKYSVVQFLQCLSEEQVKRALKQSLAYARRLKAYEEGANYSEQVDENEVRKEQENAENEHGEVSYDMKPKKQKKEKKSSKSNKHYTKRQTKY